MNGRRRFGLLWGLITLLIAGVVGAIAYQAGVATHFASGQYEGFGFFGLVPLLFLGLLLFGLSRIFWWRGPRGMYGGHGHRGGMEHRLREWHDQAHGQVPAEGKKSDSSP
jgi:hypothetical protein